MNDYENTPIDSNVFASLFDKDYRLVKEHEFRRAIFKNGVTNELKEVAWKYLFRFYAFNSTPRERKIMEKEKYVEYFLMKSKWNQILKLVEEKSDPNTKIDRIQVPMLPFDIHIELEANRAKPNLKFENDDPSVTINVDYVKLQTILHLSRINIANSKLLEDIKQIDKDIERTSYLTELSAQVNESELNRITSSLRNILITFAAFNQNLEEFKTDKQFNLGYTQGMNDIVCIFLSVFDDESVVYWCFSNFMLTEPYSTSGIMLAQINQANVLKLNAAHYFSDIGMSKKLNYLSHLLSLIDPELYKIFEKFGLDNLPFCHEWLLLHFRRCFTHKNQYQRCFEIISSHFIELHTSSLKNISVKDLYTFDLFISLSLLKQARQHFINSSESESEIFEVFQVRKVNSIFSNNFSKTLEIAEEIFEKYCIISQNINAEKLANKNKPIRNFSIFKDFFIQN